MTLRDPVPPAPGLKLSTLLGLVAVMLVIGIGLPTASHYLSSR